MGSLTDHLEICLITTPLPEIKSGYILVKNFLQVLEPLAKEIYVITGNYPQSAIFSPKIRLKNIKYDSKKQWMLIRAPKYVMSQLKISHNLVKVANRVNVVIFFIGGTALLIPILVAKLLQKKAILIATGSGSRSAEKIYAQTLFGKGGFIFSNIISILEGLNYRLSNAIIVYSSNIIHQSRLNKYQDKIVITHEHFVDFTKFTIMKKINERSNLVGYVGRLSEEKGILNLIRAAPLVLKRRKDIRFFICGDGELADKIKKEIKSEKLELFVELARWIPHEDVPSCLNELKLLVLPSYTEGLPNIVLEAMACGTPVLATPVGAIPDIIKDGETGFLLASNDPKHITHKIIELLNKPKLLEQVSTNAHKYVNENFNYEKVLEAWQKILSELHQS